MSLIAETYTLKSPLQDSYSLKSPVTDSYSLKSPITSSVIVDITIGPSITTPTVQCSSLAIVDIENDNMDLTVVRGDGDFILVIRNQTGAVSFTPSDDVEYTLGQDLGGGNIVAYVGTSTSFNVASLLEDTDTYFSAFEFNNSGLLYRYLTTSAPTANDTTFTDEYQEVLDFAAAQTFSPPATLTGRKTDNLLVKDAISIGLWAVAPRFYNHHTTGDSDYACINYKNPSVSTQATKNNSPAYATKAGFTGSTVPYLDYVWTPASQGGAYTQNDGAIMAYEGTNISANSSALFGGVGALSRSVQLITRTLADSTNYRMNDGTSSGGSLTDSSGLWILYRDSSTEKRLYRNGSLMFSANVNSTGLPNQSVFGLARNNNGITDSFSARRIDCFIPYQGSAVSVSVLNTMWNNHRTRTAAV